MVEGPRLVLAVLAELTGDGLGFAAGLGLKVRNPGANVPRWPTGQLHRSEVERTLARTMKYLGAIGVLLTTGVMLLVMDDIETARSQLRPRPVSGFLLIPGLAVFVVLARFVRFAAFRQREATIAITQIRNRQRARTDERAFFLLLRSHRETTHTTGMSFDMVDHLAIEYVSESIIARLAAALTDHGMLLVVGGEPSMNMDDSEIPEASSNLLWVEADDATWRELVQELAVTSRAVFVVPEVSGGLRSELQLITLAGAHDRTVVVMTPSAGQRDRAQRWKLIRETLASDGYDLPEYRDSGMFYLPSPSFSVSRGVEVATKGHRKFERALEELLPSYAAGRSLRSLFPLISESEDRRTTHQ